jgi:ABC-type transport system involved in multi-copper enzyme maturation permease subunit
MFRKTLALLVRALRVDARSIRPHLIRLGLLATILWLMYISMVGSSFLGAPGLRLFQMLTWVNVWFITIVGVTYFASAITEEKEERTLGLLKMADIGGASILLGKWLPRIVALLSLIVVQFPFTLLAVTLGGVTQLQVSGVYVALLLHLISVGTYSLAASVVSRNTGNAVRLAFVAILLRYLIPSLSGSIIGIGGTGSFIDSLLAPISRLNEASVYQLTNRALSTTFGEDELPENPSGVFAESLARFAVLVPVEARWWFVESLAFFVLAWLLFEPCTKNDVVNEPQPSWWARWTTRKQRLNHRRAWPAAVTGKDYMLLAGGAKGTTLRFAAYLTIAIAVALLMGVGPRSLTVTDFGGLLMRVGFGFLVLDVVQSAAKVFRVELQDQTWSALMMLPRGLNSIAWSKIAGCAIGWWPSLSMVAVGMLLVPDTVSNMLDGLFNPDAFFGISYFVMQCVVFLELTVLTSISLTWASWPLAAPLSFFLVFLSNSLLFTCLATMAAGGGGGGFQVIFFLLTGICVVIAAVLYRRIGARLLDKASEGT